MRWRSKLALGVVALVALITAVIATSVPVKCQAGADAAGCLSLIGGPTGQALAALAKNDQGFIASLKNSAATAERFNAKKCSIYSENYVFMALAGTLTALVAKGKAEDPPQKPYLPANYDEAIKDINGLIGELIGTLLAETSGPLADFMKQLLAGLPKEQADYINQKILEGSKDELKKFIQEKFTEWLANNDVFQLFYAFLDCGVVVATSGIDEQVSAALSDTKGCWNFLNTCANSLGDCLAGVAALGEAIAKGIANVPGAIYETFKSVANAIGGAPSAFAAAVEGVHCKYFGKCLTPGPQQEFCAVNMACGAGQSIAACTQYAYANYGGCYINVSCTAGLVADPDLGICTCPAGQAMQNGACAACPAGQTSSSWVNTSKTCWGSSWGTSKPSLNRLKCEVSGGGSKACCPPGQKLTGAGLTVNACGPICPDTLFNTTKASCETCAAGSYGKITSTISTNHGQVRIGMCELCPKGAESKQASLGLDSCTCPADTQLKNGACVACGENTYSKGGAVTQLAKLGGPQCKTLVCMPKNGKPQFVNDNLQCEVCPAWAMKSDGRSCIGGSSADTVKLFGTCSKRGFGWQDNPDWKFITDATGKPIGYGGPGEQCVCKTGFKQQDQKCVSIRTQPPIALSCTSRGSGFIDNPNKPGQCICKSGYQRVGKSCVEASVALPRRQENPKVEKTTATARNCPPGMHASPSGKSCLPDLDIGGGFSAGSRPGGGAAGTASPGISPGCRKC